MDAFDEFDLIPLRSAVPSTTTLVPTSQSQPKTIPEHDHRDKSVPKKRRRSLTEVPPVVRADAAAVVVPPTHDGGGGISTAELTHQDLLGSFMRRSNRGGARGGRGGGRGGSRNNGAIPMLKKKKLQGPVQSGFPSAPIATDEERALMSSFVSEIMADVDPAQASESNDAPSSSLPPPIPTSAAPTIAPSFTTPSEPLHPNTVPGGPMFNPLQFVSGEQRRHASFMQKVQELAISSLLVDSSSKGGRDGEEDDDDDDQDGDRARHPETFMSQHIDLYRKIICAVEESIPPPPDVYSGGAYKLRDIPDLSREYLRDYLREAIPERDERPCVFESDCISIAMCQSFLMEEGPESNRSPVDTAFICRELLLPSHVHNLEVAHLNGRPSHDAYRDIPRQPCLLCTRKVTHELAIGMGLHHNTAGYETIIQTHANIFDREGEYRSDRALLCVGVEFHGLIKPVVSFDRRHYRRIKAMIPVDSRTSRSCQGWAETNDIIFFSSQLPGVTPELHSEAYMPNPSQIQGGGLQSYSSIYHSSSRPSYQQQRHNNADDMMFLDNDFRDGGTDGVSGGEDDDQQQEVHADEDPYEMEVDYDETGY